MSSSNIVILDLDSRTQLEYLAEGAANVVYRIKQTPLDPSTAADAYFQSHDSSSSTPPPSEIEPLVIDPRLNGKLVRLRKNLPHTTQVKESQTNFEKLIVPLFPQAKRHLVEQTLFQPSRALIQDCNTKLRLTELQGTRPSIRHGVHLAEDEEHGLLVTDMRSDDKYKCIEFKPKWLAQSPSAPTGSRRCRTCALEAMRSVQHKEDHDTSKPVFCPLNLMSPGRTKVTMAVDQILGLDAREDCGSLDPMTALLYDRLKYFLHMNPLLHRLRTMQMSMDEAGVLKTDMESSNFLTAMTLRDCTLYVKIPLSEEGDVEARLGDVDFKSSKAGKGDYWQTLERQLTDEGWYTATEKEKAGKKNLCALSSGSA